MFIVVGPNRDPTGENFSHPKILVQRGILPKGKKSVNDLTGSQSKFQAAIELCGRNSPR